MYVVLRSRIKRIAIMWMLLEPSVWGFPGGVVVKNLLTNAGNSRGADLIDTWVRKIPWRRKWQHIPVLSPGESDGQSSLASYSPWGCKEPDTAVTECAHMHTHKRTHTHITGLSQDLSMTSSSRELKMDHSYKED